MTLRDRRSRGAPKGAAAGPAIALLAAFVLACATTRGGGAVGAESASGTAAKPVEGDAGEAHYREAVHLYEQGLTRDARARLEDLLARPGLALPLRARALTQRGVIELEDGEIDRAERSLGEALPGAEAYFAGKARFYLGEVSRLRFRSVGLDPSHTEPAALAAQLEAKSNLLLAAQERYLTTIGAGDASWAVAAGARIGELYEQLHDELLDAPLPPGLEGDAADAYRATLRERVTILVTKAIDAYQETLAAARRLGVESAFVPSLEQGLERMRRVREESTGAP